MATAIFIICYCIATRFLDAKYLTPWAITGDPVKSWAYAHVLLLGGVLLLAVAMYLDDINGPLITGLIVIYTVLWLLTLYYGERAGVFLYGLYKKFGGG